MKNPEYSSFYDPRYDSESYDNLFGIKLNIGGKKDKKEKKQRKKVSFNQIMSGASSVLDTAGKGIGIVKSLKKQPDNSVDVVTADDFAIVNPSADAQAAADKKKRTITYIIIGVVVFLVICVFGFIVYNKRKS